MAVLDFITRRQRRISGGGLAEGLAGWSIEVLPRVAAGIADFRPLLPSGTRIYVTHVEGTPIEAMVATARRLRDEGFPVMPHIPARLIADRAMLEDWLRRYRDVGVGEALLLAGGSAKPHGRFASSMELMETGLLDRYGFRRLHVAGHPEGNRDIDPNGSTRQVDAALAWKQEFAERTDAEMAIVTQFAFDAAPVIAWTERLRREGIGLPVHVGIAGPAKLQTLLRYGYACGVGPSLAILQKRAADLGKLVLPYEPTDVLAALAEHRRARRDSTIAQVHIFPLGGFERAARWVAAAS